MHMAFPPSSVLWTRRECECVGGVGVNLMMPSAEIWAPSALIGVLCTASRTPSNGLCADYLHPPPVFIVMVVSRVTYAAGPPMLHVYLNAENPEAHRRSRRYIAFQLEYVGAYAKHLSPF